MTWGFERLPGAELIELGLADLAAGRNSVAALLASIGAPRLTQLGFSLPPPVPNAERVLYEKLRAENPDSAHSRYNAMIRLLVSFERAAACVK